MSSFLSTIHGSNLDSDGKLDMERLKQNLESATDVYINTVSGSPCFGTEILLVKGAVGEESRMYHERRTNLLTFLRGPKKKLEVLRRSNPEDFKYFSKAGIWLVDCDQITFLCFCHVMSGLSPSGMC